MSYVIGVALIKGSIDFPNQGDVSRHFMKMKKKKNGSGRRDTKESITSRDPRVVIIM